MSPHSVPIARNDCRQFRPSTVTASSK
jgi:hypothetical protein